MKYPEVAQNIIALKNADLTLRNQLVKRQELFDGYHPEMEQLHIANAMVMQQIVDTIGFPSVELVGKEANDAAWLVIQHSISTPKLMKRYLELLKDNVQEDKTSAIHLAYLTDRVLSFLDQPQLYGTAFDWDENGIMNPKPFDDLELVNQRRAQLGLNTLEEQTQVMRKQVAHEQENAPKDLQKRQKEYDQWRKKVGWI